MSLNLDVTKKCAYQTAEMDWEASPAVGVRRKKLEREAAESGLTTSVVEYAAGSRFSTHQHPLGEEIFVLSGVFSDENGDYPAGSYLRNPPGSSHAPFSEQGCEILVKLNQFQATDLEQLSVNTHQREWLPGLVDGLSVMPLHSFETEHTALVRWAPETYFQRHLHYGGEEIFVLEGVFSDEHGDYPAGSWLRSPPMSEHTPFSKEGCTILVKTGHLSYRLNNSKAS